MKESIQIDSIIAEPGTTSYGFIDAGEMKDGTSVKIPLAIINGSENGEIIYIQAVSDGDELNGVAVIQHILNTISPKELRGAIIAVPIANPYAFYYGQPENIVDKKKLNRCFPGDNFGTSSQRIAYSLFYKVVMKAQYCIDLHQCGISPMIDSVNVRISSRHRLHKKCMELARVFGIGYILDQKGPNGQLAQSAPDLLGIPTIDPELGGCLGWDSESIQKGINGIQNVLKYYGFIDSKPAIPEKQIVVKKLQAIYNDRGGFIKYLAKISDIVEYHQPIADICDPFGRTVETIFAPKKGVLWSKSGFPMAFSGSTICLLGTEISYI